MRMSLAKLVMACVLPAIVMTAALLVYNFREGRAALTMDMTAAAKSLLEIVDSEFSGVRASMQTLSTSRMLRRDNLAEFHLQALEVVSRTNINNIVLIDAAGQQQLNTSLPFGTPLPVVNNWEQLRRVLHAAQPDVSNLFTGPVLKRQLINIAVPVYTRSTVTHSLVGVLLPEQLQQKLLNQRMAPDRILVIFDASNAIVALTGTGDINQLRGQQINGGLVAALKKADEGSLTTINLQGVEVLTVFTRSPSTRWGVAIGIPTSALTEDLRTSLWSLIAFAGFLLAGSLAMAWSMSGRIAGAIHALRAPALGLAYGTTVKVPALPIREVDEVGRAIEKASGILNTAHTALAKSESRMRGIVESSTDAIVILDESCNILLFNSAAVAMFGCPQHEVIGHSFFQFIPEAEQQDFAKRLLDHTSAATPLHSVKQLEMATAKRRDGTEFKAELSFPQLIEEGEKVRTLILRDMTERLLIHEKLERSNLDLQQFAYVASHDLKTPLRSISGFVRLLEKNHSDQLDDHARALIRRTADATKRLEQLTEDLLHYARVDSEAKQFVSVNMADVAQEVIYLLDASISSAAGSVTSGPLPVVLGDRTQLVQLLLNLIDNGLKYCQNRPPIIRLSAQQEGEFWVFSVTDNGIGIDARFLDKVFEVFKRLHAQSEFPGTGIGLAVCRRVVEGHGGKIWATSQSGQGSVFSFTLPVRFTETKNEN